MLRRITIFATAISLSLTFICPAMVSTASADDMHHEHAAMNDSVTIPAPACCVGINANINQDRIAVESQQDVHMPVPHLLQATVFINEPEVTLTPPQLDSRIRAPDPKFESAGLGKRE